MQQPPEMRFVPNGNEDLLKRGVLVVHQTPAIREIQKFPISFNQKSIFLLSTIKCILGLLHIILGIANIFLVPHYTSDVAFPVWCGAVFIANGILGHIGQRKPTKCFVTAFCALSIISLILTIAMLILYSFTMNYFVAGIVDHSQGECFWSYNEITHSTEYSCSAKKEQLSHTLDTNALPVGFVLLVIAAQLGCSITAVVYSCKAYFKCCKACKVDDCCVWVGCCECNTSHLDVPPQVPNQDGRNQLWYMRPEGTPVRSMSAQNGQYSSQDPVRRISLQNRQYPPGIPLPIPKKTQPFPNVLTFPDASYHFNVSH